MDHAFSSANHVVVKHTQLQQKLKTHLAAMGFIAPSAIFLGVFVFYPLVKTVYYSMFLTNALGQPVKFIGLSNYGTLLQDKFFMKSLLTTFIFVFMVTLLTTVSALALAMVTSKHLKGTTLFRTFFASTMGVSVSVASVLWLFIFQPTTGVSDMVLNLLHLPPIHWLTDNTWSLFAVILTVVWMNLGFSFLALTGALENVATPLYEVADIEGVTTWHKFYHIALPQISPTLFFVGTVTMINAFQTFGQVDLLTKGGPNNSTNLIVYQIYKDAFVNLNVGKASTESIVLALLIALVTIAQFKLTEKRVMYQ
ncbi:MULTISPECIES: carbohydrate ABC transporter permease [Leuconostoc]|uniref:carbohydrate ABC transporter permease n=1 Tax=Leuconostoc TaxID=1243 RepID=UPI0012BA3B56|nr:MULTISPECIES: sugar ABC transporter permease [Leuconostoc]QGN60259.1 ABC transporter permease subunit [Leuconostoc citreum]QOG10548.1 sugar ABC transporter permease [Leuconostoc sp. LN180020]